MDIIEKVMSNKGKLNPTAIGGTCLGTDSHICNKHERYIGNLRDVMLKGIATVFSSFAAHVSPTMH